MAFGGSNNRNLQFSSNHKEIEVMFLKIADMVQLQVLQFQVDGVWDVWIRKLLKRLPNLTSLDMGSADNLTNMTANVVAKFLPNLRLLSLRSRSVQDKGITTIAQNLKKLRSLELCNCAVTNKGLEEIAPMSHKSKLISPFISPTCHKYWCAVSG